MAALSGHQKRRCARYILLTLGGVCNNIFTRNKKNIRSIFTTSTPREGYKKAAKITYKL